MKLSILATALGLSTLVAPAASAQSPLTTLFAADNGGAAGWANYFDITVNAGVVITQLDVNINAVAGAMGTIDFYVGPARSTHVGNELLGLGAGPWSAAPTSSSAMVTSLALDTPTPAPLLTPVSLIPGTYACMVVYNGTLAPAYTNGNFMFSTNEMSIATGSSTSAAAGGTLFTPRSWNGSIYYNTVSGFAQAGRFGEGCGGTGPLAAYEQFSPATGTTNDLQNSGFSFVWLANPSEPYILTPATNGFVAPTGAPANFADDEIQQIPLGFTMPTEAGMITDVWVCSNGFVGFGPITNTGAGESALELLNDPSPRIAVYWDDMDPSAATGSGTMHIEPDPVLPNTLHITWTDVTQFIATAGGGSGVADMNTFQVTLDAAGNITCNYLMMGSTDGIVGYSPGGGITADPIDISAASQTTLTLGTGIPGLSLDPGARPIIGGPPASVDLTEFPAGSTAGVFLLNFGAGFPAGVPLDLIGADGCFLYSGGSLGQFPLTVTGATETLLLGIPTPAVGSFAGVNIAIQGVVIVPGLNALNIATSNGVLWTLGAM